MSEKIEFFMCFEPPTATAQQKGERIVKGKNGRSFVSHYKKKALKDAEALLKLHLQAVRPPTPIDGAIRVRCEWVFPWRKSETKRTREAFETVPKITRPDAANSNKLLIDCMSDLNFWRDDNQVFSETAEKYWGDEPGIFVCIEHGGELGFMKKGESK